MHKLRLSRPWPGATIGALDLTAYTTDGSQAESNYPLEVARRVAVRKRCSLHSCDVETGQCSVVDPNL